MKLSDKILRGLVAGASLGSIMTGCSQEKPHQPVPLNKIDSGRPVDSVHDENVPVIYPLYPDNKQEENTPEKSWQCGGTPDENGYVVACGMG